MEHFYYANKVIYSGVFLLFIIFSIYKCVYFTHFMDISPFRGNMKEKELIDKLIPYQSGGNYFLLYKIIQENSKNKECELTQQELAEKIQKTRKFVSEGLKVLEEIKAIEFGYKHIKILGATNG